MAGLVSLFVAVFAALVEDTGRPPVPSSRDQSLLESFVATQPWETELDNSMMIEAIGPPPAVRSADARSPQSSSSRPAPSPTAVWRRTTPTGTDHARTTLGASLCLQPKPQTQQQKEKRVLPSRLILNVAFRRAAAGSIQGCAVAFLSAIPAFVVRAVV